MSLRGAFTEPSDPRRALGYEPLPGAADELMMPSGRIRELWTPFIRHLATLDHDTLMQRFARGDEYLRDAGVFFRQYGQKNSAERDWPLSHIPVLIHESEWRDISTALVQRADLLERVMADLYGPNSLVRDGHLPPAIVASNPEWLRPLVGVAPRSGHYLNFLAFDIGRGPGNGWWVLNDRTQAPSGAGFALENRVATARVFAEFYADANVERLAGFFRSFRDALHGMRSDDESDVAILTPGQHNDTYYEHAYIARYLGLMLLEGEDLAVIDGRLTVRTIDGPRPVSVLWRRLDASYADPLELDGASKLGVPGLIGALRAGAVSLVNALGSGVLETPSLLAFLPRISEILTGNPLLMPNVATWWCGHENARSYVAANAESLILRAAFPAARRHEQSSDFGGAAEPALTRTDVERLTDRQGSFVIAQEAVSLSTTPVYVDGGLEPRPTSLRVFLARTPKGWQVMPGGFARIGKTQDHSAITMQQGGSVADVWVVSDRKVRPETMLPRPSTPYIRPQPGSLPSRAADNLFWLGRYVERAEAMMRLLRAYNARLAEATLADTPLLTLVRQQIENADIDLSTGIPPELRMDLSSALYSAGKIRDRFSVDGWMALNDLADSAERLAKKVQPGHDAARALGVLLRKITGFSGLVHENMYRSEGWRFLSIGRSLERALAMCDLLRKLTVPDAPRGALDLAIEVGDSAMSHRRRYTVSTTRETVVDLLALDAQNPRAILYHLSEIRQHVWTLPRAARDGHLSDLARAVLQLHTEVAVQTPKELRGEDLASYAERIMVVSNLLTDAYLR